MTKQNIARRNPSPSGDGLRKLIQEFFADDIMQWVGSDHHKQQDGTLEVTYSYYYDDYYQDIIGGWYQAWTVCHPGYVRGKIEGRGETLGEAIANFRKHWEEKKEQWEDSFKEFTEMRDYDLMETIAYG